MKKILIIQPIHEAGIELLKKNPDYEFEVVEKIDPEFLKSKIKKFDGASIRTAKLPGNVIEAANNLKIISRHGVGYDNIDLEVSKKKNLTLAITATANAIAVAEHVMFMLLNISKRKNMYDNTVKEGKFNDRNKLPKTVELWNKNILIAGFGRIGKALIKRCLGFEMKIFVYDPFVSKDIIEKLGGIKVDSMEETCKDMDAVSLHIPLNDKTKNIINYDLLQSMKKNCIIINAARGGIVNEIDLDRALKENLIFGAGLDVFETEPPEQNNPLLKNDKVFLSPHTASFTEECMTRMGKETVQNIIDFFDNKLETSKIVKL
jgi:D-3-phosphoglycerate dehydrogenase